MEDLGEFHMSGIFFTMDSPLIFKLKSFNLFSHLITPLLQSRVPKIYVNITSNHRQTGVNGV